MEEKHEHKEQHAHKKNLKIKKSDLWKSATTILAILLVVSLYFNFRGGTPTDGAVMSADDVAEKSIEYINENLLQAGTEAKLVSVSEKGNLYNIKLDIGGREYDSYATKDGQLLFPSSVAMNEEVEQPETETPEPQPPAEVTKSDKPTVELFVMSHCPFGTQAEKGMIPVVELLGDKIDFDLKFVNYAMHGEKEVVEQLNQYCIQEEQEDKLIPYLKCFLEAGDGEGCLTKAGIDTAALETCTEAADTEFKITESLEDKSTWSGGRFPPFLTSDAECKEYGVRGSPTLVLNGAVTQSARSPAAYLTTVCAAFNEAPEECDEELSSANPSSGFGYKEGSATTASCG